MEGKILELTQKIYTDGIEKAKKEAKDIIEKANEEKDVILNNAKKEAEEIINNAKKEADQLKNRVQSEIKMASNQMLAALKQEIVNLLSKSSFSDNINKSINDIEFIKDLIKEMISKWDISQIELTIPEKYKKDIDDFLKNKLKDALNKGLSVNFESRMSNGFKIGPKDKSFVLSFTESDFIQFFQSFLKPKTKEILFGE